MNGHRSESESKRHRHTTVVYLALAVAVVCAMVVVTASCVNSKIPKTEGNMTHIVWEGRSEYRIIYAADAPAVEERAAAELQKYIQKMTGCKLSVYSDAVRVRSDKEILIGRAAESVGNVKLDYDKLGDEGFVRGWIGDKLYISGNAENGTGRGTLYGVYDFLEELGCRFYAADTEIVPEITTLSLEKTDEYTDAPDFEYRDLFWSCTYGEDISTKLRLNGCVANTSDLGRSISEAYGGGVSYAGPHFVHTFEHIISSAEYFESHPEYFSEINGERNATHLYSQLCLTNPDVLQITIDTARKWLLEKPEAKIVSISQNDSFVIESYCTCDECSRIDEEEGSHAGTLIRFVNAVADALKDEFPDVAVDTLAYQYSVAVPKVTKPRDNVIIRYCTGSCAVHAINECAANENVRHNIEAWGAICDRIYIWDYTTNFRQYLSPFMNFYSLVPNIQFFKNHGVSGVFEQGMYQEGNSGEFAELRSYIMAKALWNTEVDVNSLIDEFTQAYYGEAAPYVRQYIDFMYDAVIKSGKHHNLVSACYDIYGDLLSAADIEALEAMWSNAKEAVQDNALALSHVRRSELSWRYYKMSASVLEFGNLIDAKIETEKFYADCAELGVMRMSEGEAMPSPLA